MADDFYEDEENEGPPPPLFLRIIGKIFKFTGYGIIVLVFALLFWRVFISTYVPGAIKTIAADAELAKAYDKAVSALADGERLKDFAYYQAGQDNIATDEDWHKPEEEENDFKKNDYAQFFLTDVVFFPTANQAQVVLRYNNSVLEHLREDYELESTPKKSEDVFELTLVAVYDPTPLDDSDPLNVREKRLEATVTATASTMLYAYRQICFKELPDFDCITEMYVDIYYVGAEDGEDIPYSRIEIYNSALGTRDYDLDRKDIDSILSAG